MLYYIRVNIAFRRVDIVHELDGFNYPHFADSIWIAPRTLTVARQIMDEPKTGGFFGRPILTAVQYYLVKGECGSWSYHGFTFRPLLILKGSQEGIG